MGNPVVHWELLSGDPAGVSEFYARVFDWKIQPVPAMNYRILDTDNEMGIKGGIIKPERHAAPGGTLIYIAVDDLAAYRKKVVAAGGKICLEEQEVPGMGSFSLFTDPEGRLTGLWKTAVNPKG